MVRNRNPFTPDDQERLATFLLDIPNAVRASTNTLRDFVDADKVALKKQGLKPVHDLENWRNHYRQAGKEKIDDLIASMERTRARKRKADKEKRARDKGKGKEEVKDLVASTSTSKQIVLSSSDEATEDEEIDELAEDEPVKTKSDKRKGSASARQVSISSAEQSAEEDEDDKEDRQRAEKKAKKIAEKEKLSKKRKRESEVRAVSSDEEVEKQPKPSQKQKKSKKASSGEEDSVVVTSSPGKGDDLNEDDKEILVRAMVKRARKGKNVVTVLRDLAENYSHHSHSQWSRYWTKHRTSLLAVIEQRQKAAAAKRSANNEGKVDEVEETAVQEPNDVFTQVEDDMLVTALARATMTGNDRKYAYIYIREHISKAHTVEEWHARFLSDIVMFTSKEAAKIAEMVAAKKEKEKAKKEMVEKTALQTINNALKLASPPSKGFMAGARKLLDDDDFDTDGSPPTPKPTPPKSQSVEPVPSLIRRSPIVAELPAASTSVLPSASKSNGAPVHDPKDVDLSAPSIKAQPRFPASSSSSTSLAISLPLDYDDQRIEKELQLHAASKKVLHGQTSAIDPTTFKLIGVSPLPFDPSSTIVASAEDILLREFDATTDAIKQHEKEIEESKKREERIRFETAKKSAEAAGKRASIISPVAQAVLPVAVSKPTTKEQIVAPVSDPMAPETAVAVADKEPTSVEMDKAGRRKAKKEKKKKEKKEKEKEELRQRGERAKQIADEFVAKKMEAALKAKAEKGKAKEGEEVNTAVELVDGEDQAREVIEVEVPVIAQAVEVKIILPQSVLAPPATKPSGGKRPRASMDALQRARTQSESVMASSEMDSDREVVASSSKPTKRVREESLVETDPVIDLPPPQSKRPRPNPPIASNQQPILPSSPAPVAHPIDPSKPVSKLTQELISLAARYSLKLRQARSLFRCCSAPGNMKLFELALEWHSPARPDPESHEYEQLKLKVNKIVWSYDEDCILLRSLLPGATEEEKKAMVELEKVKGIPSVKARGKFLAALGKTLETLEKTWPFV